MRHLDPQVASTHTYKTHTHSLSQTHTCARSSACKSALGHVQERAIKLQHMLVHVPCGTSLQKRGADGLPTLVDRYQCNSPLSLCPRNASKRPFPLYFHFYFHFTTPLTQHAYCALGPPGPVGGWKVVYIFVHEDDGRGLWPPPKSPRESEERPRHSRHCTLSP